MLESFLTEYREKRQHHQQKSAATAEQGADFIDNSYSVISSTSTTTDTAAGGDWAPTPSQLYDDGAAANSDMEGSDNDEELCFNTPEQPTGVELVVNLLTTWGDKFYVGLTGIEVYTNTGEPADIVEVSQC